MAEDRPIVFVVDDDARVREAIEDLLASVGLRAELLGSAKEFLRCKRPESPSCLVLDVRLPGISGLDLQHELAGTENRITVARRDYVASVQDFNTALRTFPTLLWAKTVFSGTKPMAAFTATEEAQTPPKVKF